MMNRFVATILIALSISVHFAGTVTAFEDEQKPIMKRMAFSRLRESGIALEEAEKYSMYMQVALAQETQWDVLDYSVTASLINERGGAENCANLQCAVINGQLLDVDYISIGTLETIGKTFSITVQVVDVTTGRMVANVSKFFKGKEKVFVKRTIPGIAKQIAKTIIGKNIHVQKRNKEEKKSFAKQAEEQANQSFGDIRGYLSYSADGEENMDNSEKLAFGYLYTGWGMKKDDVLRYSYQLQSYLADVGACAMLYIDEMERLMQVKGGNLKCRNRRCAENVGKLLGVNYMGYGKIFKIFGFYFVRAYIIDVEDGGTVIKKKKIFRGKEIIFLTETIPQIAFKLGEVLERKAILPEE